MPRQGSRAQQGVDTPSCCMGCGPTLGSPNPETPGGGGGVMRSSPQNTGAPAPLPSPRQGAGDVCEHPGPCAHPIPHTWGLTWAAGGPPGWDPY